MSFIQDFKNIVREYFKTNDFIPLHEPNIDVSDVNSVKSVLDSSYVSTVGQEIELFEKQISSYCGSKYGVSTVNGTSSLHLSLIISGVDNDSEVLTQALSFVATSNAIKYLNAFPVFIDVDTDTMGMCPNSLSNFLNLYAEIREEGVYNKSSGRRIAACIPTHVFGFVCRINEIKKICDSWGIPLIEDAAEALGSYRDNKHAGTFGKISAISFNGNKIITTGGGGILLTNDYLISKQAKHLSTTAKTSNNWEYIHDRVGYNYRMPNLNAALGMSQFKKLENILEQKNKLFQYYLKEFQSYGDILVIPPKNTKWNHWMMSLRFNDKSERDEFLKQSNKLSIGTRPIWKLLFELPMFKNCQRDDQKNAKLLESTIVNIPSNYVK